MALSRLYIATAFLYVQINIACMCKDNINARSGRLILKTMIEGLCRT